MRKAEAITRLKLLERRLRERGINALYLFGSTTRDEAGSASDLDLLYEYDPARRFSLFDQAGAMLELSDTLEIKVDLVSRISLRPRLRVRVEGEMVRVFNGRAATRSHSHQRPPPQISPVNGSFHPEIMSG